MNKTKSVFMKFILGIVCSLLFMILLFCSFCYFIFAATDDAMEKEDIFTLVTENQDFLLDYIEKQDFLEPPALNGMKEVRIQDNTIEFSCGGSGLGSATYYCGFFYSESDDLNGIWCAPPRASQLKPFENGFLYEEGNGDNRYYAEHICGHFYFYEASF